MSKLIFLLGTQFFLQWLELWLGGSGIPLPLAECGAIYCALAFGAEYGIAGGILAGAMRCAFFGAEWNILLMVLYPLLAAGSSAWIDRHEEHRDLGLWLPGVITGFIAALPAVPGQIALYQNLGNSALGRFTILWLWSMAITALLFPLMLLTGETLAEFFGLPRFMTRVVKRRRV